MPQFWKRKNLSLIYGFLGGLTFSFLLLLFAALMFSENDTKVQEHEDSDAQIIIKNRILLNRRASNFGTDNENLVQDRKKNGKHYIPGDGRHRVEPQDLRNVPIENFVADEVNAKKLIFYGVLTRGEDRIEHKALWDTWGSEMDPKDIGFFTGSSSSVKPSVGVVDSLNFIPLPGKIYF